MSFLALATYQWGTPMLTFTINGKSQTYSGESDMPLLWYLRDEIGLTGTKFGCGLGLCGSCTVHMDGVAVRSCQLQMGVIDGKSITTIEGLAGKDEHPLQKAWKKHNVPQCGYCQAGQLMQAASLLATNPQPTDAQIDSAMQGNICRCGTYQRIKVAIKTAVGGES